MGELLRHLDAEQGQRDLSDPAGFDPVGLVGETWGDLDSFLADREEGRRSRHIPDRRVTNAVLRP